MTDTRPWTIISARATLPALYNKALQSGALEWQSIQFWTAVLGIWAEAHQGGIVSNIFHQTPSNSDPRAISTERLRRIDFQVSVYDAGNNCRRFPLLFVEGKGPYASIDEKEKVESQGFDACEGYLRSPNAYTTTINCLCVVGTRARAFQMRPGSVFKALWGDDEEVNLDAYIDAAAPESIMIWRTLDMMASTSGVALATPRELPVHAPPPPKSVVIPSQSSAPGPSRSAARTHASARQASSSSTQPVQYAQQASSSNTQAALQDTSSNAPTQRLHGYAVSTTVGNNCYIYCGMGTQGPMKWYWRDGGKLTIDGSPYELRQVPDRAGTVTLQVKYGGQHVTLRRT